MSERMPRREVFLLRVEDNFFPLRSLMRPSNLMGGSGKWYAHGAVVVRGG